MFRKSVFVGAAVLCACGGSSPLDTAFAGQWAGVGSTVVTGGGTFTSNSSVVVAVDGNSASVASVCLLASGAASFSGTGATASLFSNVVCPPISLTLPEESALCGSIVLTYIHGTATLTAGNPATLTVVVTGQAVGCGNTYPVTNTFIGFQ